MFAAPCVASDLTVNQPHRADTYSGVYFGFSPSDSYVGFTVNADDAHNPPVPDRIFQGDNDTAWSIWNIQLCDDGHCGTVRHVCTISDQTREGVTLDCLDVDC